MSYLYLSYAYPVSIPRLNDWAINAGYLPIGTSTYT